VLERTRYIDSLEGEEDAAERRANVEELVVAASGFSGGASGALTDFLAEAALVTDADRAGEKGDRVLLLTAHNAKGLEFDAVAVIGLEEGLMPHAISSDRTETLEEERRLFYVALTRAREEVLLTAAGRRRRYDGTRAGVISRFVQEIPRGLLEWEEEKVAVDLAPSWRRDEARPVRRPSVPRAVREDDESANAYEDDDAMRADTPLRLSTVARADRRVGQRVRHATYGEGVVVEAEEGDGDIKYTVRFGTRIKKIVGRFLEGVR
jgi:DNA helicase-2/ATP-dependent DNA helicase PcrA